MFERCDPNVRIVVDVALEESRDKHHTWLGTEHVLLALARRRDVLPDDVAELLPDGESVAGALAAVAGPGRPDAQLLKTVGIDLDEVRSAVRQTFGDEAVQRLRRPVAQPWQPWRRPSRRCTSLLVGELSVTARMKEALERARRHANRRHLPEIDPVSLLLGMVDVEDAMANRLLRQLGVDPAVLRTALFRHTG